MAKILIVEDSLFQRNIIKDILIPLGHTCVEATDGKQGLELINSGQPDCVVLDINMPEISGEEVLKTLKSDEKTIPVIIVSADIQNSIKKTCIDLGARAFLHKPVEDDLLIQAVSNALQ